MHHNIPLVGGVILALVLFSLTFNLCVRKMTRSSLRGVRAYANHGGIVRLPLYKSFEFPKKGLYKGCLLLWVSGLLTGIALIAACGIWVSTVFGFNEYIQTTRWVPEMRGNYMFILNHRMDFWPGDFPGFMMIFFVLIPMAISYSAATMISSSLRALLMIPVANVFMNYEKSRLEIETWMFTRPPHLR